MRLQTFRPALALLVLLLGQEHLQANDSFTQRDYRSIQNAIVGYLQAINARDAASAASFWSESGEWIGQKGERAVGRAEIQTALAKSFAKDETEMTLRLESVSVRALTGNVAIEDGTAVIQVPGQPDEKSSYSVVHIRDSDGWKISAIRETVKKSGASGDDELQGIEQLSWMIGTWFDQSVDGSEITIQCDWTPGQNAIRRKFTSAGGAGELLATQIILWDAKQQKIRSWVYDVTGSFGNGVWERKDASSWSVESTLQSASGQLMTSTNLYRAVDSENFEFSSTNRALDGRSIDNIGPVVVSRAEKGVAETVDQTNQELTATQGGTTNEN